MDITPEIIKEFLKTLSEKDRKSMILAQKLLNCTFDLKKSNAFLTWFASYSSSS